MAQEIITTQPMSSSVIDAVYSGYVGDTYDADRAVDAVLALLPAVKAEALREAADAVVLGGSVSLVDLPFGSGRREISAWLHRRARHEARSKAGRE
jgi:hypothetical protein